MDGILEGGSSLASVSLVQQTTLAMVAEVTSGALSTAQGREHFVSLERRWVLESCEGKGGSPALVNLPRHSIESFAAFMWWLVTDADRARSFSTIMRTAGAVMTMLELEDWTKTARIKAQVKEIQKVCGIEPDPCTQTTRRLITLMDEETIQKVCSKGRDEKLNMILTYRTRVLLVLELLAGLRVGEATSSGDLHGLEANSLCFLNPAGPASDDKLGETVEVVVKDSKTGPGRHAAFVAKTQGPCALEGGNILKTWLQTADMAMGAVFEGGFTVITPNYWVARVNLASWKKTLLDRFMEAVSRTKNEVIAKQSAAIIKYTKERYAATSLGEELRYVNVAGGYQVTKGCYDDELAYALDWLEQQGFGKYTTVVPGPLVRSTLGKVLTHMPLSTGSTYTHLVGAMNAAHAISEGMAEPDVELDLQGLDKPKWGNHSLRRHSDKVARESMHKHKSSGFQFEVNKELIDYFYGWLLKERNKDMQLHYAGLDRVARRGLARVTMFL